MHGIQGILLVQLIIREIMNIEAVKMVKLKFG